MGRQDIRRFFTIFTIRLLTVVERKLWQSNVFQYAFEFEMIRKTLEKDIGDCRIRQPGQVKVDISLC